MEVQYFQRKIFFLFLQLKLRLCRIKQCKSYKTSKILKLDLCRKQTTSNVNLLTYSNPLTRRRMCAY